MGRLLLHLIAAAYLTYVIVCALALTYDIAVSDEASFARLQAAPQHTVITHHGSRAYSRYDLIGTRVYMAEAGTYSMDDSVSAEAIRLSGMDAWIGARTKSRFISALAEQYEAHGWPYLSVSASMFDDGNGRIVAVGGWPVGNQARLTPYGFKRPRVLALRPIWCGFIGNVVIYAGCIAVLSYVFRCSQRMIRRHYGQCANCGYDLRSGGLSRCPECGFTERLVINWGQIYLFP